MVNKQTIIIRKFTLAIKNKELYCHQKRKEKNLQKFIIQKMLICDDIFFYSLIPQSYLMKNKKLKNDFYKNSTSLSTTLTIRLYFGSYYQYLLYL